VPEVVVQVNTMQNILNTFHELQEFMTNSQDRDQDKSQQILSFCITAKSVTEIMKKFGYQNRTKFKHRYLSALIKDGKLEMTLSDKPSSRYQKYITKNRKEEEKCQK